MIRNRTLIAGIVFGIALYTTPASSSVCQIPGGKTWVNELGSEVSVEVDDSGRMSGTYTTAVGCGEGKAKPMSGFCNGYAVTFTVNWEECLAATAWSGTYENGKINTLWQLVSGKRPSWNSIIAGTDVFNQK